VELEYQIKNGILPNEYFRWAVKKQVLRQS
jgi:hypothetical protein